MSTTNPQEMKIAKMAFSAGYLNGLRKSAEIPVPYGEGEYERTGYWPPLPLPPRPVAPIEGGVTESPELQAARVVGPGAYELGMALGGPRFVTAVNKLGPAIGTTMPYLGKMVGGAIGGAFGYGSTRPIPALPPRPAAGAITAPNPGITPMHKAGAAKEPHASSAAISNYEATGDLLPPGKTPAGPGLPPTTYARGLDNANLAAMKAQGISAYTPPVHPNLEHPHLNHLGEAVAHHIMQAVNAAEMYGRHAEALASGKVNTELAAHPYRDLGISAGVGAAGVLGTAGLIHLLRHHIAKHRQMA